MVEGGAKGETERGTSGKAERERESGAEGRERESEMGERQRVTESDPER